MTTLATDDQIQALVERAKPFTFMQLRWTAERHVEGADAIELQHQRRMVGLHADGAIAVLCPVQSDVVAGVAIMTQTPDEAAATMSGDPCVEAGMMTFEVHPCMGFSGDSLPA